MSKLFKAEEVASHNNKTDLYIIVDQDVYDVTKFQSEHPGGQKSKLEPAVLPSRNTGFRAHKTKSSLG